MILIFRYFSVVKRETMTIKKIILSVVVVTLIALSIVACSGTKSICPAYSDVKTESPANPNS